MYYEMYPISHFISERQKNFHLATERHLGLKKYLAGSQHVKLCREESNQRFLATTGEYKSCRRCCPSQGLKIIQSSMPWRSTRQVKGSPVAAVCYGGFWELQRSSKSAVLQLTWSPPCHAPTCRAGGGAATGTFLCLKKLTHYQKCPVTDGVGEWDWDTSVKISHFPPVNKINK